MHGHTDTVTCVRFNHDSTEIVSSSCDFTICLWNAKKGKLIKKFIGHDYIVCNVNFNNNSTIIVSSSLDGSIRLWDIKSGTVINKFEAKGDICRYAILSPTGNLVISYGNRRIFIWSTITCQLLKTFECHDNRVDLVSFCNNGNSFYSCGIDEENDIFELFKQRIPKNFK
jgi:WD40 repeat protein